MKNVDTWRRRRWITQRQSHSIINPVIRLRWSLVSPPSRSALNCAVGEMLRYYFFLFIYFFPHFFFPSLISLWHVLVGGMIIIKATSNNNTSKHIVQKMGHLSKRQLTNKSRLYKNSQRKIDERCNKKKKRLIQFAREGIKLSENITLIVMIFHCAFLLKMRNNKL